MGGYSSATYAMMSPGSDGSSLDSLGHMATMEMSGAPNTNIVPVNSSMVTPMADSMTAAMMEPTVASYHSVSAPGAVVYPSDPQYMTQVTGAYGSAQNEYAPYYMGQGDPMYPSNPTATPMSYCIPVSNSNLGDVANPTPLGETPVMITSDALTAEVPGPTAQPVELETSDVPASSPVAPVPSETLPEPDAETEAKTPAQESKLVSENAAPVVELATEPISPAKPTTTDDQDQAAAKDSQGQPDVQPTLVENQEETTKQ